MRRKSLLARKVRQTVQFSGNDHMIGRGFLFCIPPSVLQAFKGMVHLKMKMLSSFTNPHVIANLRSSVGQKKDRKIQS